MVPALLVELESLPLSPNGKIDKKALPVSDTWNVVSHSYVAPRNETESVLAEIWQHLLEIDKAGIYDNFFEMGGHSLLIIRLREAIKQQLHVELLIKDVFANPTIAALALHLENANQSSSHLTSI
jgi:hypothetical protein